MFCGLLFFLLVQIGNVQAASVTLNCPAATGSASGSLATANVSGSTATDQLIVTNAPVGTIITIVYTATNPIAKTAQTSLNAGSATGPLPAAQVTISATGSTGSKQWIRSTGATDPVIDVTLRKSTTSVGGGNANWTATCSAGRTVSISNSVNGAEPGTGGELIATLSSVSPSPTTISMTFNGTASNGSDYTHDPSVTIPAGSLSAVIPITVLDDSIVEPNETIIVGLSIVTSGAAAIVAPATATNLIISDDTGSISVATTDATATETAGDTGAFTVVLDASPTSNVNVNIGASPQCSRSPTSLTFTSGNWNVPQSVILTPNDDAVVEGPHSCSPASISATSGGYAGITATPPVIAIADNDIGSMSLTVTDASATEGTGDTGSFTLRLNAAPVSTVSVAVGSSPECVFSPSTLSFSPGNFSTAQAVTVTPHDDALAEGPHSCTAADISASGGAYDGVTVTPPTTTILDNDVTSVTVAAQSSGSEPATDASVLVSQSLVSVSDTVVSLSYAGVAQRGVDYTAPSQRDHPGREHVGIGPARCDRRQHCRGQ